MLALGRYGKLGQMGKNYHIEDSFKNITDKRGNIDGSERVWVCCAPLSIWNPGKDGAVPAIRDP